MQQLITRTFPSISGQTGSSLVIHFIDRRHLPPQGKWKTFKKFLWNKHKNKICGHSLKSWSKLILFYALFLTLTVGLALFVISKIRNEIKLHCKLRPCMRRTQNLSASDRSNVHNPMRRSFSSLFSTKKGSVLAAEDHITKLDKLIDVGTNGKFNCTSNENSNRICPFAIEDLGPCGNSSHGYKNRRLCIYMKLNNLYGWIPEYYNDYNLPEYMPIQLKNVILGSTEKELLWIYCEGLTPADTEHLGGITYYPVQGYRGYYFQLEGTNNPMPIVAIRTDDIKEGYIINLYCSLWAKNINYKDQHNIYSTNVQIYLQNSIIIN
ncbi:hypothetical protein RI129_005238 [Pyrocoelia pectoralis]|uniref:Uncharacterized protein n=1 Tax=Pyrocoelia pectoralis TaxID=417401 RepID=A0AAN7VN28_9COLE